MRDIVTRGERCVGCRACEIACSYYQQKTFNPSISSLIIWRGNEKEGETGIMLKKPETFVLAYETGGVEEIREDEASAEMADKPILSRKDCDSCIKLKNALCTIFCLRDALIQKEV